MTGNGHDKQVSQPIAGDGSTTTRRGTPGDPSQPFSGTWEGTVRNSHWKIVMTLHQDGYEVTGTISYSNCAGNLVVSTAATMTSTIVAQEISNGTAGPYCQDGTKWYLDVLGDGSILSGRATLSGVVGEVFRADLIRDP